MKKTKTQRVKEYLRARGNINTLEAQKFGVTRLSSIIYNLDKQGWKFNRITVFLTDDFGDKEKYTSYILDSEPIKK